LGEALGGSGFFDECFLCGRNIVVTGLPTGWKVQVDARTAVVESGGSVTIDVDTWALPATTIKVLDGADVEQGTLTPSGGIFGGDIYLSGDLTGEVQIPADVRVIQQNRIFANASIQVSTLVNGEVSANGSINAAQQNEVQITASIQTIIKQPGEVFTGATVRVTQRSQVQIVSSLQPSFNGQTEVVVSIKVVQRIDGQISAQGSILVKHSGAITDPIAEDNRVTVVEHGAQTEVPILWRD
jgi:cytoskeletal protein CcmA (bactofilin family)